jgi:putative adhesin
VKATLLALLLATAPAFAQPKAPPKPQEVDERTQFELQPAQHAFTKLAIDNPLGDVRIEGWDGTGMLIETHKHAPDRETVDRLGVTLVPSSDGTVRIATTAEGGREVRPVPRSQVRVDLIIRAPRSARVDAAVSSGKLEVRNMDGGAELDSSSGSINASNVQGELVTHSVSGPMTLAQVFGSVDAATVSSDVDLDSISGEKLVASASKGRIAGRRVRSRDVELTTTDGRIMLEAEAALRGHLVVSSLHGDVDVRIRRHGTLAVRARGVKVDLGAQQQVEHHDGWTQATLGTHGDPAAMVELQSRYGMVQFAIIE